MKKKFISAILFGALLVASSSAFVSCKDYDDDISELRTEITTNAKTLESMVTEKETNLNALIAALQTQDTQLTSQLATAKSDLQTAIAAAETDAKSYADVQAAAARVAAIEAAQTEVANAKAQLEASLADANTKIAALESTTATNSEKIAALVEADAALQTAINTAKAEVAEAAAQAKTAADNAQAAADAAQSTANSAVSAAAENAAKLQTISENLTTINESLQKQITALDEKVTTLQETVAANKAAVDAQLVTVTSSIESNTAAIEALKNSTAADKAELLEKITANTNGLTELSGQLVALQGVVDANLITAKEYADAQVAALKAKLGVEIQDIQVRLLAVETKANANAEKITAIESSISDLKDADTAISEKLNQAIEDAKAAHTSLESTIATVNSNLETLAANAATKEDLESTQMQLETLDGYVNGVMTQNLNTAINSIGEVQTELDNLTQSVSDYIEANDEALTNLQVNLISGYNAAIDKEATALRTELSTAVSTLESQISALETKLTKVDEDLQEQIDGIKSDILALKGDNGELQSLQDQINSIANELANAFGVEETTEGGTTTFRSASQLTEAIKKMKDSVNERLAKYDQDIENLWLAIKGKGGVQELLNLLQDQIDTLTGDSKQLKSLVFDPQEYYQGIEALEVKSFYYTAITGLESADVKKNQTENVAKYGQGTAATAYTNIAPAATASYYLNPSNANVSEDASAYKFAIVKDLAYTRAASEASLKVNSVKVASGMVNVNFTVSGNIKSIEDDEKVTVAALQYTYKKGENSVDTTVTSDFAALRNTKITSFYINKAESEGVDGNTSTHDQATSKTHLAETAATAIPTGTNTDNNEPVFADGIPYLEIPYNQTAGIDLNKWIDVHYNTTDKVWGFQSDINKDNFKLVYELIGYKSGTNDTNESQHATIAEDGHTLTVHAVESEETNRKIVGRTPLIRVTLVDQNSNNQIAAVGYICVKITDVKPANSNYTVTANPITNAYTVACAGDAALSNATAITWLEVENQILGQLDLKKADFEELYKLDVDHETNVTKQFTTSDEGKTFSALDPAVGTVTEILDPNAHETNTLQWTITQAEAYAAFVKPGGKSEITTWVRFVRKADSSLNPVYVKLTWKPSAKNVTPSATINNSTDHKKASSWFEKDARSTQGWNDIQFQVGNYEVSTDGTFAGFKCDDHFVKKPATIVKEALSNYPKLQAALALEGNGVTYKFSKDQTYKTYCNGKYTVSVTDTKIYALTSSTEATNDATNLIATITNPTTGAIAVAGNDRAKEILNNYEGIDNLNKAMTLTIEIVAKTCAPATDLITISNNKFNVKVIKPLFIKSSSVKDVTWNVTTGQKNIPVILNFSDFNDFDRTAFKANTGNEMDTYYDINKIEMGTVKSNYDDPDGTTFKTVDSKIFTVTYTQGTIEVNSTKLATGTIDFTQKGSNSPSKAFTVKIPLTVTYKWGTVETTVNLTVQPRSGVQTVKRKY